ncbi:hypothetical protein D3C78_603850 [compost metagenome]
MSSMGRWQRIDLSSVGLAVGDRELYISRATPYGYLSAAESPAEFDLIMLRNQTGTVTVWASRLV